MRKETPWGPWEAIGVAELAGILRGLNADWFIAGGYALDAFAGRSWREHEDIDFAVPRDQQLTVQEHLTPAWELHYGGDPSGTLKPWPKGVVLRDGLHDIWARKSSGEPWRFQLMLNDSDGGDWVYRRDPRVRLPLAEVTFERDGIRFIRPEIQLMFKSKGRRPKDEEDFEVVAPLLNGTQRRWLIDALGLTDEGNPWLARLRAM